MGNHGFRRTRKLCKAQHSSITRSRRPAFHRRIRSFTMRQRLTLLFTCSIRSRRPSRGGGPARVPPRAAGLQSALAEAARRVTRPRPGGGGAGGRGGGGRRGGAKRALNFLSAETGKCVPVFKGHTAVSILWSGLGAPISATR